MREESSKSHLNKLEPISGPVKVMHHIHWISMIVLFVSGLYIYSPWVPGYMDTARFSHFLAMYVLATVFFVRIYYALFGDKRDIVDFMPSRENKGKLLRMMRYYLFIDRVHPATARYNPLQKATYNIWFFLLIIQGVTGFALYWPQSVYFGWVVTLCGGLVFVRLVHFILMIVFAVTVAIHFYLVLAEDFVKFKEMFLPAKKA